jgi:anaerobic ribonucleoside-triphosphate reductase activating protein
MVSIKIAGTVDESVVDGEGIRFTIFTQGCPHKCEGCHNPHTHDYTAGKNVTIEALFTEICENPLLQGVTFSGGEPFAQPEPLAKLAKMLHEQGFDITTYTGYTLEELQAMNSVMVNALLAETDVLIDGKFIISERDLTLQFRGSRNQRLIDMKKTREQGMIILKEFN